MINYLALFVILTVIGILYDKYKKKYEPDEELKNYDLVKKYLLNDGMVIQGKPCLWIHSEHLPNTRNWQTFLDRKSTDLNQPYIETCVENIIKYCNKSFNICLIDDASFEKLIPGWNMDMSKLTDPLKNHARILGFIKLLYYFGGMMIPNSLIVSKDLKPLYDENILKQGCFCGEFINQGNTGMYMNMFPSMKVMGCQKNNQVMKKFMEYAEILIGSDYTNEMDYLGQCDRWLYKNVNENKMALIDGKILGTKDKNNELVRINELLEDTYIDFSNDWYGIYLPGKEILKRSKYSWFAKLSKKQLFESKTMAGKLLLLCSSEN